MTEISTRTQAYAEAFLLIARAEGTIHEVEDELFRFGRTLEGNSELLDVLSDPHIPAARRQQIVEDLLDGRATSTTVALVSAAVAAGRGHDLPKIITDLADRARDASGVLVAEVRSAVALSEDQQARLAAAISAQTKRDVTLRTIIDPTVVGGVVTQIGDSVIDGSVRTRLTQLRDAL